MVLFTSLAGAQLEVLRAENVGGKNTTERKNEPSVELKENLQCI